MSDVRRPPFPMIDSPDERSDRLAEARRPRLRIPGDKSLESARTGGGTDDRRLTTGDRGPEGRAHPDTCPPDTGQVSTGSRHPDPGQDAKQHNIKDLSESHLLAQRLRNEGVGDEIVIRDASSMDRPIEKAGPFSRRNLVLAGLVLTALLIGAFLFPSISRWAQSEISVDISRVRIEAVTRGDLVREVAAQGNIVAAFHPTLFSPVRGIVQLDVRAGETVTEGQVLARIQSPEVQNRLEQERSTLFSLQADLGRERILAKQVAAQNAQNIGLLEVEVEAARRAMERAERTRDQGLTNDVEFEQAQDNLQIATLQLDLARRQAQLQAESLEFDLQTSQLQLDRQALVVADMERQVDELALRSPVDGLVSNVAVNDQDAVNPNQAILTVVDLSAFEVEIMVAENYADEIGPGTDAAITYGSNQYPGVVKSISPEVEGARVRGRVEFVGELPAGLKQNQRVTTALVLDSRADVIKVARGPFVEAGAGRIAYVVEDGIAIQRPIEVGALSISEVEILSGLAVGDRIIVSDTTRFEGAKKVLLRQ